MAKNGSGPNSGVKIIYLETIYEGQKPPSIVNFFFGSREDRLNLSCGEPESCYFRKNGEEGRTK